MLKKRSKDSWAWHWCDVEKRVVKVQVYAYHDDTYLEGKGRLVDVYSEGGGDESEWEMYLHDKPEDAERDRAERLRQAARQSFVELRKAVVNARKEIKECNLRRGRRF